MRIVVDVMGGDHGSGVVIDGVKLALQATPSLTEIYLVGDETEIHSSLARLGLNDPRLHVVHAREVLTMQDDPVLGLRKKKDCSIARAVQLVKEIAHIHSQLWNGERRGMQCRGRSPSRTSSTWRSVS